jgi:hypothetical protein
MIFIYLLLKSGDTIDGTPDEKETQSTEKGQKDK